MNIEQDDQKFCPECKYEVCSHHFLRKEIDNLQSQLKVAVSSLELSKDRFIQALAIFVRYQCYGKDQDKKCLEDKLKDFAREIKECLSTISQSGKEH